MLNLVVGRIILAQQLLSVTYPPLLFSTPLDCVWSTMKSCPLQGRTTSRLQHAGVCRRHAASIARPGLVKRVQAATTDADTGVDAFQELVRMAVAKDPSLASLAEQQIKQKQQVPARPVSATAMLGPSLSGSTSDTNAVPCGQWLDDCSKSQSQSFVSRAH